jgi:hypothetical protein
MVHYLAVAMFAATAAATPGKLDWQADYGQALEATRSDHRPLLVVLDVPANPEAALDQTLLSGEGEQAALLGNYQLCHVDASTEYGQQVAKAFGATQFPHTAIIDRNGAYVLFKKPGQITATEWNATLTRYQSGEQTTARTVSYRGSVLPASSTVGNSSYCPSCQRSAMGL